MMLELVGAAAAVLVAVAAVTCVYWHFDRELKRTLKGLTGLS